MNNSNKFSDNLDAAAMKSTLFEDQWLNKLLTSFITQLSSHLL